MTISLPNGKKLEVGRIGIDRDQLPSTDAGPLDLKTWFDPKRQNLPLELEIGCGKGTFLVQQAAAMPDVNLVGIEYAKAFWRHAADRCRRHVLEGVRVVHYEATTFVRCFVPHSCLRRVHVYFPDPWPKKRHHKRRLICESFLRILADKLEPSGSVRIATDHSDYFQWILDHAGRVSDRFLQAPFERPESAVTNELVGSNFERKYRREGRPFHGITLLKHK